MSYDWEARQWTVPLNQYASKTVKIGKTPWKSALEVNYFVESPKAVGQEWMTGFNVTPVVKNIFAKWMALEK